MEKVSYAGWPDCLRLTNSQVELIATTRVGPRIIRFGFVGDRNEFQEFEDQIGRTDGDEWRIYGGHRLWHSPEAMPRSYAPDNGPVRQEALPGGVRLIQPAEPSTGIQKELDLWLSSDHPQVRITHRLRNVGIWPVELAPWAISVMAPGGVAIIPQSVQSEPDRLLPNRVLALWPYTDMTDSRVTWGKRYLLLRQDRHAAGPIKLGTNVDDGWAAYVNDGHLFVKRFAWQPGARYADYGVNVEAYTAAPFLELETLGPLTLLKPGETTEHVEQWHLLRTGAVTDEASADREVRPLAEGLAGLS